MPTRDTTASVFLDRDGVINQKPTGTRYVTRPDDLVILPRVPEAIRLLNRAGCRVFVVSNQSGISEGLYSEQDLQQIHERMVVGLLRSGAALDAIYHCPHRGSCACRKPGVGMFLQAQRDFPDVKFERSIVVGDSASDMEAAGRLGCKKVLLGDDDGRILHSLAALGIAVEFSCRSLPDAVEQFLLPCLRAYTAQAMSI